jgi:hypothetical protein
MKRGEPAREVIEQKAHAAAPNGTSASPEAGADVSYR